MANRLFNKDLLTLEKQPVALYFRITFGASGAPTLDTANSKGVKSISRTSAGLYVLTLSDTYQRLLSMERVFVLGTGAPAAPLVFVVSEAVNTLSGPVVTFQCVNGSGTATDPASGEELRGTLFLRNSTAL